MCVPFVMFIVISIEIRAVLLHIAINDCVYPQMIK